MNELPNLLIISEVIPQAAYAGSLLLYRLLKSYPQDRILVIGKPPLPEYKLLSCEYKSLNLPCERLNRTRFSRLARSLRSFVFMPDFTIASVNLKLRGFKADAVLCVMQTQPYYYLAYRYAKTKNLPLFVVIHDLPEAFEPVYPWMLERQLNRNIEVYKYAKKRFCVSPQMRDYLGETYKAFGDVLYPIPAEGITPRPESESLKLKEEGVLTIGYAGSLWGGYGEQLKHMVSVFKDAGVKLRLYSYESFFPEPSDEVIYRGYAPAEETWARVKAECDAVILFYSWPEYGYDKNYSVHFPSKLPEYLALGMPVLIFGPEYATGVKWGLSNSGAALVVTENNPESWIDAFNKLKESADLRQSLSRNAVFAGKRDFAPEAIRQQFLDSLKEAGVTETT
ncbi:MAG: hypothetical protein JW994_06315 [Candidatus Omnitrophica bacterium]|nr:hypothetical protein [Candidatus Omnitrophota bacterium]